MPSSSNRVSSTSSRRGRIGAQPIRWACATAVALLGCGGAAEGAGPITASIPHGPGAVQLVPIATGLVSPVAMANVPGDASRLFVVEQTGQLRVIQNGTLLPTPALNIASSAGGPLVNLMPGYDERGLLGVAFDPNFNNASSPGYRRLFTWSSETTVANPTYPLTTPGTVDHQNVLTSWRMSAADPNVVDQASRTVLLREDHPQFNHDAGTVAFGPDGYLYYGDGDGGGANDVGSGHNAAIGNAQDLASPLGKIHRIDVNGTDRGNYGIPASNPFKAGPVPEVYAYGFRNPYRFSFDGNRLLVADVGQNNIEEVDDVVAGGNYGWRYKEGTFKFNPADGTVSSDLTGVPAGLIDPVMQYDHDEGIAISGGFVYHGAKMPWLQGKYVFGDFSTTFSSAKGRLFYSDLSTGAINEFILPGDLPLGLFVKGIGQGPDGELYLMASSVLGPSGTGGQVLAIVPEPTAVGLVTACALLLTRRRK